MDNNKSSTGSTPKKRRIMKKLNSDNSSEITIPETQRRTFLGNALGLIVGVATTALSLVTPTKGSRPPNAEVAIASAREYTSANKLNDVVQTLAGEQIENLSEREYLESESISTFPLEDIKPVEEYVNSKKGTYIAATAPEDNAKVRIQTKRTLANGQTIELTIRPDSSKSRAIIYDNNGVVQENIVYGSRKGSDVGVLHECEGCSSEEYECGIECNPYGQCSCVEYYIVENCGISGCFGCITVGYNCSCGEGDTIC